jgi:hypothetical protein
MYRNEVSAVEMEVPVGSRPKAEAVHSKQGTEKKSKDTTSRIYMGCSPTSATALARYNEIFVREKSSY